MSHSHTHEHFKGKDAIGHVAEAQARGIIASKEIHGTEVPGHISAGADAARETAVVLALIWILLVQLNISFLHSMQLLAVFSCGWTVWKFGRSAWLGWSRLERLHRILGQEKWEIEHHRQQEREELTELYAAKGFEGKLLKEVIDVLMADDERLLRVMVEEELGLSLQSYEHPLKQGFGAFLGCLLTIFLCFFCLFIDSSMGLMIGAAIAMAVSGGVTAYLAQNRIIPAIVWNIGLGVLAIGIVYFLFQYLRG